jgi:Tfp pilus assembly protein PilN
MIARLAASTHEANALIDERTFSWSALFARLERTLPFDVRVVAVSPEVGQNVLKVSLSVVAKELDDVAEFIDNLSDTGAFYDVQPTEQRLEDDNTYTALIVASYLPGRGEPPAAAAEPAPAAPPASPAGPARGAPSTGGRK